MQFDTIVVKRDYTAPRFDWRIFTPEFHKPGVPQRPQRVDVQVPVRYRRRGDEPWSIGRTENLSRTGVLIRGVRLLPAGATLLPRARAILSGIATAAHAARRAGSAARAPADDDDDGGRSSP